MNPQAHLNQIATAVPPYERHGQFVDSLPHWIKPPELAEKVRQIVLNSQIDRRYTVLENPLGPPGSGAFYEYGSFPSTQRRMETYRREALPLALKAVGGLPLAKQGGLKRISHVVVTSCTGFYAPGLDIEIVSHLGLSPRVKRTVIGFMGCYAALTGLRVCREIVQADPEACVLMVNLELCSLHLQETTQMDRLISFLLFADGAAASIISGQRSGLRLDDAYSHLSLADADRMGWIIEDNGFAMTLDPRVPARIRQFIRKNPDAVGREENAAAPDDLWAVHPGGRSILDAVQEACCLTEGQMAVSRGVLRNHGNMSSATIMFALRDILHATEGANQPGHAIAFGPGLTLEGLDFTKIPHRELCAFPDESTAECVAAV